MLMDEITSSGAIPALELMMKFAGARHRVLAHNIANNDTPNFQPLDVSVGGFQRQLREAVEARRGHSGGMHGGLSVRGSREVGVDEAGAVRLSPSTSSGNILMHDRNNSDMERSVQTMVENLQVFRVSTDLLRSKYETLRLAISDR